MELFRVFGRIALDGQAQVEQGLERVNSRAEGLGRNLDQMGGRMRSFGGSMSMFVTGPIVAAGAAAAKLATDFESSIAKMNTLVGVGREEIAQFRQGILDLAPAVGVAPQELADAMFAITSAGQRGSTAMETLEAAAKASAIGLGETREIALAASAAVTAYGEENITATEAVETLLGTVEAGNLQADALAGSLGRIVSIAAEAGVSLNDAGAFIAAFTRQGVSAEQAVTGLRGVLATLVREPTKAAVDAFEKMGMSVEGFRQQIRDEGFINAFQELVNKAEESGVSLGNIIPEIEGLTGALAVFASEGASAADIAAQVGNAVGSLDERLRMAEELDPSIAFRKMSAELKTLGIEIGANLLPALIELATFVKNLSEAFRNMPGPVQKAIVVIAGIVAALGPVIAILGTVISVVGRAIAIFVRFAPALGRVIAVGARFIPIVGQIIAVITAAILIFQNWETIVETVVGVWKSAVDIFSQKIEEFANAMSSMKEKFSNVMSAIADWAREKWDQIKSVFQSGREAIAAVWESIKGVVAAAVDWVVSKVTGLRDAFIGAWEAIRDGVVGVVQGMVDRVKGMIDALYQNTVGRMQDLWNTLVGNSIIVDLADDVISEMGRMADGSIAQTERFAEGVEDAAGFDAGMGGMSGRQRQGGGVNIDMRHTVFRDDRHLDERLRRSGHSMAGAF